MPSMWRRTSKAISFIGWTFERKTHVEYRMSKCAHKAYRASLRFAQRTEFGLSAPDLSPISRTTCESRLTS